MSIFDLFYLFGLAIIAVLPATAWWVIRPRQLRLFEERNEDGNV